MAQPEHPLGSNNVGGSPPACQPVIDLHCHVHTPEVEALVAGRPEKAAAITRSLAEQGPESSRHNAAHLLPDCTARMSDIGRRLSEMDGMGVDVQVLSPSPGQYYYWADFDLAAEIVRLQNTHIARLVADHPKRLLGLGGVALQHPALAVEQLDHAVRHLGLRGVEISTLIDGRDLDDPEFEAFWQRAEELAAVVFIHPLGTSLGSRLDRFYLSNIIGQPLETTIALSKLIFSGVLDRRPGLKLLAAHGGGYLPTYAARSDHAWANRPDSHAMARPLSDYLRQIHFDILLYKPEAVAALAAVVGVDRLVIGTDYPFDMGHYDVESLVAAIPSISDSEREAILGGNALRLLNFDSNGLRNHRVDGCAHCADQIALSPPLV
ncbi:amidohydrolase [Sphingomonas populi]|uniref:Amidohydrolase n=1 Tax=Sphingomonas populi TaxID=2484750 RepID=A0A4Q6XVF8_9SPHN|nr:amidohydrolase family protein [Sphingomonas populi]RZF60667.1 amidohydrolase [Sphingomonas populi]